MMKITFLGTGIFGNNTRVSQGILFKSNDVTFMIDTCGGGEVIRQLAKIGETNYPKHIFLTHRHPDHSFGLPFLLFCMRKELCAQNVVNIYGSNGTIKNIQKILDYSGIAQILERYEDFIIWNIINPNQKIRPASNITITAFYIPGRKLKGDDDFGFIVKANNSKLTISGDCSPNKELIDNAYNSNILIHECFSTDDEKERAHSNGHSTARDVGEMAKKANVKKVILIHIHQNYNWKEFLLVKEVKKYFNGEVEVAKDLNSFIF